MSAIRLHPEMTPPRLDCLARTERFELLNPETRGKRWGVWRLIFIAERSGLLRRLERHWRRAETRADGPPSGILPRRRWCHCGASVVTAPGAVANRKGSSNVARTHAPSGRKNCPERTGLLLGTERQWSHCGERQRLSRDPAPPAPSLVRGFGGSGANAASTQQGILTMPQEAAIKQDPPDGLRAGSSACDAPQQTGRDHCHHNGGNWLAAPLGPRLFGSGGAQKTRPDACLREDRRRARLSRHRE